VKPLPSNTFEQSVADKLNVPLSFVQSHTFLLNRTAKIGTAILESGLKPLGLTRQKVGIMRIIAEKGPCTQQSIAKINWSDRTTIVNLLDELEEIGLTIRTKNPKDKRSHLIFLTPKGNKVFSRATRIIQKQLDQFLAPLEAAERTSLQLVLLKLLSHHQQ
jgi:MarR family transcriptional regulator, lower aerobic nicotinate degradation pathway regulator